MTLGSISVCSINNLRHNLCFVLWNPVNHFYSNLFLLTSKKKLHFVTKFPTVSNSHVYGCESWTIKKAEHWRIDASQLWCWRRLLRLPWTARRLNQSILKEISPEYLLKGLMLKLKPWYFGHLMERPDSFEKTLMLGKTEVRKRRGRQRMRWLMASLTQWTWVWVNSGSWWWTGRPGVLQSMELQRVGQDWTTEPNWNFASFGLFKFFNFIDVILPVYLSASYLSRWPSYLLQDLSLSRPPLLCHTQYFHIYSSLLTSLVPHSAKLLN